MNKELIKKIKKRSGITLALLSIAAVGVIGGRAYAKYFTKIDGSGNAEIARWSFKANGETTEMEKIQLKNVYNKEVLKDKAIAPGTNGSFDILLDATGADVAIDYVITFDNLENKPTNLKFTYDGITKSSLKELEDLLKGRILLTDERKKTITIEWSWDYQTGDNEQEIKENDLIDTNDSGKEFTFDITITGTQINPQE